MAEYIEREALLEDIDHSVVLKVAKSEAALFECRGAIKVIDRIEVAPAVDVAEVRYGEWIYGEFDIPHCSECGYEITPNMISPYCPNCGARMDGDTE